MSVEKRDFAGMGVRGGQARAVALTPEKRQEIARKASAARWSKERMAPTTITITAGAPVGKVETQQVEITILYESEPLVTTGEQSWTVNSRSFVITQSAADN